VLKDLGIKEPPVKVEPILEYFGIELEQLKDQEIKELQKRCGINIDVPAFLYRKGDKAKIFVRENEIPERKRLSIFHECGHYDIPWHRGVNYMCDCKSCNEEKMKDLEKEAFRYAGGLMFPSKSFNNDINDLPVSMQSISNLAEKYEASFEATAIKYIQSHPGKCAILYLIPILKLGAKHFFYQVKYSIKSKNFHRYWKTGTQVKYHGMLESSKIEGTGLCGEIPASIFGSTKKHNYYVEVKTYGPLYLCVFLKLKDKQTKLL